MNPFRRYAPGLSLALICGSFVSCLMENPGTQTEAPAPKRETAPVMEEWNLDAQIESKELQALSRNASILHCGDRDFIGADGTLRKDILTARPEVLNYELAHLPALAAELGFDKVETCAQAEAMINLTEAKRMDNAPPDLTREMGPPPPPLAKEALKNGVVSTGKIGIVQLNGCTGYMISAWIIVTAAHCLDGFIVSGYSGNAQLTIDYFDPVLGRRNLARAQWMRFWIAPTFRGSGDTESDVGFVLNPSTSPWSGTNLKDWLKVYTGSMSQARNATIWGRGLETDGGTAGTLRWGNVYVDYYGDHHIFDNANDPLRICSGDSGGPWIRTSGSAGTDGPDLVLAHTSNFSGTGSDCAQKGSKMRATRMNTKIGWISSESGIYCQDKVTSDNLPYKFCW